jgi:phosphoadenosine phosphosulfate reductase
MGDGVLASLAASVVPGIEVVFLDTGYHFAETIGTRDAVAQVYDVKVRTVLPLLTVAQQDAEHGADLWRRDPDSCCAMRKVEPLARALKDMDAYATGIRRDEAPTRADTPVVEWDEKRGKVKVNPIAAWTQDDVDAYIEDNGILVNPLAYDGYPSIGCAPCTHRVAEGEDPRSGRWKGSSKTECGLHV